MRTPPEQDEHSCVYIHVYCACIFVSCVPAHVHRVHVSEEGHRAPPPGGQACLTHRTRGAPALSASWLLQGLVARPPAQPQQGRKGTLSGSRTHQLQGPPGLELNLTPGGQRVFQRWSAHNKQKRSEVTPHPVLPDCLPGAQVLRGKRQERPRRRGGAFWRGVWAPWLCGFLAAGAPAGFVSKPHPSLGREEMPAGLCQGLS